MLDDVILLGFAAVSVAAGLVAGVFLTFSDFVMRGLAAAPGGARAMAEINRTVYRSVFMGLFLGLVPVCAVLLAVAGWGGFGPAGPWVALAAALYLAGVFGVTAVGNVPMNQRLDRMSDAQRADYWPRYLARWTRLNHLRSVAAALAAMAFLRGAMALS